MERQLKIIDSSIWASILSVVFVTVITIGAELFPSLKDWLKNTFGHHWVGKSILASAVFVVGIVFSGFFSREISIGKITKRLDLLFYLVILGSMAIVLFFLWEAFWR